MDPEFPEDLDDELQIEDLYEEGASVVNMQRELITAIKDNHDLDVFRYNGLRDSTVEYVHYPDHYLTNIKIEINVVEIGENIEWELILPEDFPKGSSITSSKRTINKMQRYKARHEFVSETISYGETDRKLMDVFPIAHDGSDLLTPDFIIVDEDMMIHAIEVGTSRASMSVIGKKVLNEKLFKYHDALDVRSKDKITTLTAIVVTPKSVISNIKLPQRIVNELMDRMYISILLENEAEAKGIIMQQSDIDSMKDRLAKSIEEEISKIKPHQSTTGNVGLMITDEYLKQIQEEPDRKDARHCYWESKKRAFAKLKQDPKHEGKVRDYIAEHRKGLSFRRDTKPITVFPLIDPTLTPDTVLPKRYVMSSNGDHGVIGTLWNEALSKINSSGLWKEEDKKSLLKESLESNPKIVDTLSKTRKMYRKKYHRVDLKRVLSTKVRKHLARDGLLAKSKKGTPENLLRKNQQKAQFDWDTSLNDIEHYLASAELFENSTRPTTLPVNQTLDLIEKANILTDNENRAKNIVESWSKTKLFKALDLISDISFELAISAKQNTESNEFIVKKLRYSNVYILIKPTNSRSHIFYSLYFPDLKEADILCKSPFRVPIFMGKGWCTEFCSIRLDKIENQAGISASLISLVSFWADFHNMSDLSPQAFKSSVSAKKMLLLSILLKLEDKAETEESITLSRYMYMEIFKSNLTISKPDPFKVLSKFTVNPRSRLNLWVIKKIICGFSIMLEEVPRKLKPLENVILEEGEDALPGDEWDGLINVFSMTNIRTATAAVNLMYLGYLKNKNEAAQSNSDWLLLKKILEEEFTVDCSENGKKKSMGGLTSSDVPKKKQFSRNNIMLGSMYMEKRLKNILGSGWKTVIGNDILEALSRHLTHEISTLKASSVFGEKEVKGKVRKDDPLAIHRVKVIEAIVGNLGKFGLNPFLNLRSFINSIIKQGDCIISDLFKKNQHGGLREIYVLQIESRIIQLYIETIGRVLCSYFEEETLTHPHNKLRLLDQHKTRSFKESTAKSSFYADLCSSSDKTRWNQNFLMAAMVIPLIRMTPSSFHESIKISMNFWVNKKIKIPPSVCQLLINNVNLRCEVYSELKRKFWGKRVGKDNPLGMHKPLSPFITTSTGMMQGILHYTSSLLHLTFLFAGKAITLAYLKMRHPSVKFSMTQVCSSDDSASILTLHSETDQDSFKPKHMASFYDVELALYTLTEYCKYFCMLESIKSTIAVPDYIEFNSEFLFKNTIAIPTIKFVAAVTNLTESESMMDRFYTSYNLISDLFSTGFPGFNTHMCQIAQAFLHYKTMGSVTNGLFTEYYNRIIEYPSPIYGFFLLDTCFIPGVLGLQYSRWLSIERDDNLKKMVQLINYSELESNTDGSVYESLIVKHGDSRRWMEMLRRINEYGVAIKDKKPLKEMNEKERKDFEKLHESRLKLMEENYMLLFRHPENVKELKIKLLMKASMPGVAKSLSKGNPFIQSLQMSVYAINTHTFTSTRFAIKQNDNMNGHVRVKEVRKYSLLLAMDEKIREINSTEYTPDNLDKMIQMMFPMIHRYREARNVIESFGTYERLDTHRIRQRKATIIIQPKTTALPLTLLQTVSHLWFGFVIRTSQNIYKRCLSEYRLSYPWIKEGVKETLKASPFSTMIELYSFLSSSREKVRKFVKNGPSIHSNRFAGQINQMVRKTYLRSTIIYPAKGSESRVNRNEDQRSKMSLALTIPLKTARDKKVLDLCEKITRDGNVLDDLNLMNRRNQTLTLISLFVSGKMTSEELLDQIRLLGNGYLITFTNPQKKTVTDGSIIWKGEGSCIIEAEGIVFKMHLCDDGVTKIITNSWSKLRPNMGVLREVFRKLGCQYRMDLCALVSCSARFDGTRFQCPSGRGVPIIEDPKFIPIKFDMGVLNYEMRYGMLSIVSVVRGERISVLEYKTNVRDINMNPKTIKNPNDIWECWVNQSPMPLAVAYDGIGKAERFVSNIRIDEDMRLNVSQWIRSTLTNRVKYLGAGYVVNSQNLSTIADVEDTEDMDDDEYEQWYQEMQDGDPDDELMALVDQKRDEFKIQMREDLAAQGVELGPEVDEDELINLMGERDGEGFSDTPLEMLFSNWNTITKLGEVTLMNKDTSSYLYLHPLWDDFIAQINEMDPSFFSKVLQGITPVVDQDLGRRLMRLMKIEEKTIELNVTQRYARNLGGVVMDWWDQDQSGED